MTKRGAVIRVIVAGLVLGSCGGAGQPSSQPAQRPAPAAPSAAAEAARAIDVCALAPDAEVARALGARVRKPARGSQSMGAECDYDLDFGDGHVGLYFVWAGKPTLYFSRDLATGEAETINGLGQDAWIQHAMPEDSWDLHVLVAPDLAFEAKGEGKERVLALGRLLVQKLR